MAYITKDDCLSVIDRDTLASLADDAQFAQAQVQAESETFGYLRNRFDIEAIKKQTGAARNLYLVLIICDITIYHLSARRTPKEISDLRAERYSEGKKWLEQVAQGDISPDLPLITKNDQNVTPIRYGSNTALKTHY